LALELAGITKETPDPVDGIIDRDPETGELIGSLQEGAMILMDKYVPSDTMKTREAGLRYAVDLLNSYGITAMQDAALNGIGITASLDAIDLKTYQSLEAKGELTMRVVGSHWWARDKGLEQLEYFKQLRAKYTSNLVKPLVMAPYVNLWMQWKSLFMKTVV
jgi:predicted amidohydrolase YtcJ